MAATIVSEEHQNFEVEQLVDITSNNHHIIILIKIKIAILSNQITSHLFFQFLVPIQLDMVVT